jgi:hypothetical protein
MAEELEVIPYEKAIEMIQIHDGSVHTFRSSVPGMLFGADWPEARLLAAMKKFPIHPSGPVASKSNHAIVLFDDRGPLFIETKEEGRI